MANTSTAVLTFAVRPTSDVNYSETVCQIYIKISQILNIDVDRKLLKFHVNQTTCFRDIDVGSWPNKRAKKWFFIPTLYIGRTLN